MDSASPRRHFSYPNDDDELEGAIGIDHTDSVSQHGSMTSSTASAHLHAMAEKAALETEVKALREQNTLELETLQAEVEMQQRKLQLDQRRREMQLKVRYAKAHAMERTYAGTEAAMLTEVCFTSPIDNQTITPKRPPQQQPMPQYPPSLPSIPIPNI